jgi:hypothetical protein
MDDRVLCDRSGFRITSAAIRHGRSGGRGDCLSDGDRSLARQTSPLARRRSWTPKGADTMNAATLAERQARERWSGAVASPASAGVLTLPRQAHVQIAARWHYFRRISGLLEDAVLLVAIVFMFPLVILLVGASIGLCVRAVIEIVHLFS